MGGSPRRAARGRAWAGLFFAAILLALAWALWPASGTKEPGGAAGVDVAAPPDPPAPGPALKPAAAEPKLPPLEELPEPIQRYLAATPYPSTSGRLSEQHGDLLRPNLRHERPHPIPDTLSDDPSGVVSVLFTADHWHYEGPATVEARLAATRGGKPVPVEVLGAHAIREGRGGLEGQPVPFEFSEHGDEQRAAIPLQRSFDDHHGPILLWVQLQYAPGRVHSEELRIFYTPESRIPGRLTGLVSDTLVEGNLVLQAGIEVFEPGFYRIDANLYDAAAQPVAFATFKGDLDAGSGVVPLEVYGKVLHDAGIPGPFTVRQIRGYRFLEGRYPDREQLPPSGGEHVTRAWPVSAFGDEAWVDEHELHVVELMLEDLERGIALDLPGLPAPGEQPGPRPPDDDVEVTPNEPEEGSESVTSAP